MGAETPLKLDNPETRRKLEKKGKPYPGSGSVTVRRVRSASLQGGGRTRRSLTPTHAHGPPPLSSSQATRLPDTRVRRRAMLVPEAQLVQAYKAEHRAQQSQIRTKLLVRATAAT